MTWDNPDTWTGYVTDYMGIHIPHEVTLQVHPASDCAGRHCVIHNPSDHHMRDWRLVFRADKGMMERHCPHGHGHTDPDDVTYQVEYLGNEYAGVHGCDGCCTSVGVAVDQDVEHSGESGDAPLSLV